MRVRAIVSALALAACGQTTETAPAPPQAAGAFDLNVEIGRYSVMLDQVGLLTHERPGVGELEVTDERDLARRLRETAWLYNLERSRLCAKGLFTELACGPAYEPVWISEPATATPTLEELRSRAAALREEVTPLWQAVCDDAASRVENEQERMTVCPME